MFPSFFKVGFAYLSCSMLACTRLILFISILISICCNIIAFCANLPVFRPKGFPLFTTFVINNGLEGVSRPPSSHTNVLTVPYTAIYTLVGCRAPRPLPAQSLPHQGCGLAIFTCTNDLFSLTTSLTSLPLMDNITYSFVQVLVILSSHRHDWPQRHT